MKSNPQGLAKAKALIAECIRTQSTHLDLGNLGLNSLRYLPELWDCEHIEFLNLGIGWIDYEAQQWCKSSNRLTENSLAKNDLTRNNIDFFPEAIAQLKNLTCLTVRQVGLLEVSYNSEFCDARHLQLLPQLQQLDLSGYRLGDLTALKQLQHLRYLALECSDISDITFVQNLTQLVALRMKNNNISDLTPLVALQSLTSLELNRNKITDLAPLTHLPLLAELYVSSNQLKALVPLKSLNVLGVSNNKITDLTPITYSNQLTELHAAVNRIEDVTPIVQLAKLRQVNLEHNAITHLPRMFIQFCLYRGLAIGFGLATPQQNVNLSDNDIVKPPLEIVEKGVQAAFDWFEAEKLVLREAKVILIGDAKAGKTSLLRRLKDDSFDDSEAQTDGINIEDIEFSDHPTFAEHEDLFGLTGHFWDFGGQEIMNATHQFFLTRRSLYVLLLDARNDVNVAGQIRQWVKRIQATGGDSDIIVVANQIDVNSGFGFDGEYELKKEFKQIRHFIELSCKTGQGLMEVKLALEELLPKVKLFETQIDVRWLRIKDELQDLTKFEHYLAEDKFIAVCQSHGLREKRQQVNAIEFFNDLGLLLHFDEIRLADYFVLDPYWITYGVYQIVMSHFAAECKGRIPINQLDFIVNEEEDKTQAYRASEHKDIHYTTAQLQFLIDILCTFKLCFRVDNAEPAIFILPDLLTTTEPYIETETIRETEDKITLVYEYEYLPKFFIPNLMVELHSHISELWRTGFIYHGADAQALVSAYDQRLTLHVIGQGLQKRDLMAVLRNKVDKINRLLTEQPRMKIPLPQTNLFADYQILLKMEQKGRSEYEIFEPDYYCFSIAELLAGIRVKSQQDEVIERLDNIDKQQKQQIQRFDQMEQKFDQSLSQLAQQNSEDLAAIYQALEQQLQTILTEVEAPQWQSQYQQVLDADTTQLKLKAALPLFFGVSVEAEFDVKKWFEKLKLTYPDKFVEAIYNLGLTGKNLVG